MGVTSPASSANFPLASSINGRATSGFSLLSGRTVRRRTLLSCANWCKTDRNLTRGRGSRQNLRQTSAYNGLRVRRVLHRGDPEVTVLFASRSSGRATRSA